MKKICLGLMALLVSMTLFAERVSVEEAAVVANNFMNPAATSALKKAQKPMVLKKAASATENQYYIYENASGEGWVMVAASDIAHPILAYSPTGHFRTDNQPANLKTWLQGYDRQILLAEKNGKEAPASIQSEWAQLRKGTKQTTATPVVAPLIKTGWDQDAPFWNLCPKKSGEQCYVGCVATAMAQVMNYYQWPVQGTGSHSVKVNKTTYTVNFGETTYDWAHMKNVYSGSYTTTEATAVATLMYHCGVACDMEYGTADEGGSGAWTIDWNGYWSGQGTMCAEKALSQFFGYDASSIKGYYRDGSSEDGMRSWTKSEWIAMLKVELDAARPIMYAGAGLEDPNDESTAYGHSFVCDGYDSSNKFHFNFGWTNWCDGYYDVDALETTDPGSGGGNGEYNLQQDVIVGIKPLKTVDPFDVTWMANGTQFTTTTSTGKVVLPTSNPTACEGKVFVGWCNQANYTSATTAPTFVKAGDAVEEGAIFYAVFATKESTGAGEANWTLVTDASTLAAGDLLVMACTSKGATAGDISSQIMASVTSTFSDNEISSLGDGTVQFTLGGSAGSWTLSNGSKKLGATAVKKVAWDSGTQTWSISISSGDATIQNGTESYGRFLYNASSPRFTTYTSNATSSMLLPQLYRKGAGATYSNYSTTCENSGTDVENVELAPSTRKIIYNGQVYILREGRTYTLTGQEIK